VAKIAQGSKGRVLRKKFVLPIEYWFFILFLFFSHDSAWCHLQCDHHNLNVKFLIFSKKIYKVYSIEVLSQDPHQQKESYLTHNYKYGVQV
jgi:hypothetical protein